MKEAAQKKIVEIFSRSNRLDQKVIPAKVRSVIAHTSAPIYLFIECLDPSGVSNSPNPIDGLLITQATRMLTLPRFHVHQNVDNFLMNGERDGQQSIGTEPTVPG